ncbi:MAG TPA: hypothetical protein VHB01_07185 [Nitrosospira sp.]|nr:hypothetical protein [Nitrosospira sp.]
MIIRVAKACGNSVEAEQPAEPLSAQGNCTVLDALIEFYEASQTQDEEEAEVDLMVQLSGMVNRDWRMEDPEFTELVSDRSNL